MILKILFHLIIIKILNLQLLSNYSRIQWLASEGAHTKALSVLNSSKVAQVNARSFNLMKEKHPEQDEKEDLWNLNLMDDHKFDNLPTNICLNALKSFDRTTCSWTFRN